MNEITTLNFFGENGITSTSANHIANLAKEAVRNAHERLAAVRFYTETVGLLTSDREAVVRQGWENDDLDLIQGVLNSIVNANSLIAYLREAIKEKERRMQEAKAWKDMNAINDLSNRYMAFVKTKPVKASYPTEEDVKKTWSIGEQEKYLSLEAEAAALGKFIHEDGHFSCARIDLMNKIQNPSRVDIKGSETVVYHYKPTTDIEKVDKLFNQFQKRYREVQAELNGMKKRVEDIIFNEKLRIDKEYAAALREFNAQDEEFRHAQDVMEEEQEIRRNELMKEVQNLKIVIPNRHRAMYDMLTSK